MGGSSGGGGGQSQYVTPTSLASHPQGIVAEHWAPAWAVGLDASTGVTCYVKGVSPALACGVLQFGEDKQVSSGPMVTVQVPSSYSSCPNCCNVEHFHSTNLLVSLDSSSFVACWDWRSDEPTTMTGHLHCFVLEVSGSSITNADTAVEGQGKRIDQQSISGQRAHLGLARAADSSDFVICWKRSGATKSGHLTCAPFSVSGRAVSAVGQEVIAPLDGSNHESPAVAGLTGTSAVACTVTAAHWSTGQTQCISMSWTAGDLNTLTFDPVKPTIPFYGKYRSLSRLSDTRALLCFVDMSKSTYVQDWYQTGPGCQRCAMVESDGSGLQMKEVFSQAPTGTAEQRASQQHTIALGPNKVVTTWESRRRQGHVYTKAMDVDEATGQVTQAGPEIMIGTADGSEHPWVGMLGSDRAFSTFKLHESLGKRLYVVPQW